MIFSDVVNDIKALSGRTIRSIRPGANLIIEHIDENSGRITVISSSGKRVSRSFSELMQLWKNLNEKPAIHVDKVLNGSGTSRNQPETILANLPYIEWLICDKKKHLAYVGRATHPLGTIKQMGEATAESVREILRNGKDTDYSTICITSELANTVRYYERLSGVSSQALNIGSYEFIEGNTKTLFVSSEAFGVSESIGTYKVVKEPAGFELSEQLEINGKRYCIKSLNGINVMILVRDS